MLPRTITRKFGGQPFTYFVYGHDDHRGIDVFLVVGFNGKTKRLRTLAGDTMSYAPVPHLDALREAIECLGYWQQRFKAAGAYVDYSDMARVDHSGASYSEMSHNIVDTDKEAKAAAFDKLKEYDADVKRLIKLITARRVQQVAA